MDIFQTLILAGVQAVTEFRSNSSFAHPILVPAPTGWEDQRPNFDAAAHGGTLLLIFAWKGIWRRASPA